MTNNLVERLRTLAMDLKKIGWQEDRGHVLEAIEALSTTPGKEEIAEAYARGVKDAADIAGGDTYYPSEGNWIANRILSLLRKEGV